MAEKPIDNPTGQPRYVAGRLIPPGETRLIPEEELPPHLRDGGSVDAKTSDDDVDDEPLHELLERSESEITEGLARLSDHALDRLYELEQQSEKPREDVLATIAGERQKPERDPAAPAGTATAGSRLAESETDHKTEDELTPPSQPSPEPGEGDKENDTSGDEAASTLRQAQGSGQAIAELRARKVGEIAEVLPQLSNEELDRLEVAEEADEKPRKGVLEAISEERLKRAQQSGDGA